MADHGASIEEIQGEFRAKVDEALGKAVAFARARPHVAVGEAFGVGWVLGNGLHPRMVAGAARLGWKAMLGGALASSGLMGALGAEGEAPTPPRARAGARPAVPEGGPRPRSGSAVKE
jgi:hypothetical protein